MHTLPGQLLQCWRYNMHTLPEWRNFPPGVFVGVKLSLQLRVLSDAEPADNKYNGLCVHPMP